MNKLSRRQLLKGSVALTSFSIWPEPSSRLGAHEYNSGDLEGLLLVAEKDASLGKASSAEHLLRCIDGPTLSALWSDFSSPLLVQYLRVAGVVARDSAQVERAIGIYDQLQLLSKESGNGALFCEAVIGKLTVLTNAGRAKIAARLLREQYPAAVVAANEMQRIELDARVARIFEELHDFDGARNVMQANVMPSVSGEHPDYQLARYIMNCRLSISGDSKFWSAAELSLGAALELLGPESSLLRRAQVLTVGGQFLLRSGDFSGARVYAKRSEAVLNAAGLKSFHFDQLATDIRRKDVAE